MTSTIVTFFDVTGSKVKIDLEKAEISSEHPPREVQYQLFSIDLPDNLELVYFTVRKHLNRGTEESISVPEAVKIFKEVDKEIDEKQINRISVPDNFDKKYVPIMRDIRDHYNVSMNLDHDSNENKVSIVIKSIWETFLAILAQIVWAIYNIFNNKNYNSDIIFFYGHGRFKNKSPILEASSKRDISHSFVHLGLKNERLLSKRIQPFHPISLGRFSSLSTIRCSFWVYTNIVLPIILDSSTFTHSISIQLEEKYQISLNNVIESNLRGSLAKQKFWVYPKYCLALNAIRTSNCHSIVIGSTSLLNQVILFAGKKMDINRFHTPHTIVTHSLKDPNVDQLISGEFEIDFLDQRIPSTSQYEATGRPYLSNLYQKYNDEDYCWEEGEPMKIMIATQPEIFNVSEVSTIIETILKLHTDARITIKLHPDDRYSEYNPLQSDSVTVTKDNLFNVIRDSHLVIFKVSNVGMESMVIGTPVVSYNPPRLLPFMEGAPLPVLETKEELSEWIADIDNKKLRELAVNQSSFVEENYELSDESENRIINHIVSKSDNE